MTLVLDEVGWFRRRTSRYWLIGYLWDGQCEHFRECGSSSMVSLSDNAGEYSLHVYEAKRGDFPTLGSRNSAESGRVQQGSPGYLADLMAGRNIDPRVRKMVDGWLADPGSAGLVAQLRGEGIPVTYEMVNARTSGDVVVSQFDLGGVFRLKLVGDELVIVRG